MGSVADLFVDLFDPKSGIFCASGKVFWQVNDDAQHSTPPLLDPTQQCI
jgi:hypothetical protein|tara:strand:+ start:1038 stop:1184 length:147 start_codon:yes stop_codon:yes gene_type:complete